ncbi:MurR/RpiR family transcriptional regulator [Demequina sp.]|uniref:MurR/RpiR family transcriptional regulator n=1 Tax=Demequina sp. TaxID=2050685 RepID=UPI003A8A1AF8
MTSTAADAAAHTAAHTAALTAAGTTPLLERLRAELAGLTPAERRVADQVLRDPLGLIHRSVSEVAQLAETSTASVVRLCATLGLRGYQDLKITLATQQMPQSRRVLGNVDDSDDAAAVVDKVLHSTAQALEATAASLDASRLEQIADAVLTARRVQVGAVGTSAPLAADAAYRLMTLGIDATFVADVHTQHVAARMLGPDDLFLAISHTGSTIETLAAARAARDSGAATAAITSFSTSPLTDLVDAVLVAGSVETAYRVEAMASRIVHLAVLDALHVTLALRRQRSAAALALTEDVLVQHRI